MRKNKGLFLVLATLLAVTCLLISCNSEVANSTIGEEKGLSYITFGGGNSKTAVSENSVTISYDLAQIGDVYWVYTATKADHGGKVGETTGSLVKTENNAPAKGLNGVIGPFSKGSWNFTLEGYKVSGDAPTSLSAVKGGTLVFTGSVSNVSLTTTSNGSADVTPIDITISLITSGTGVINLEAGTKFYWAPVNDANPAVYEDYEISVIPYIDGTAQTAIALTADTTNGYYKLDATTAISSSVAAGVRAVKFDVVHPIDENSNIVLNSCASFNVTVYGGQTTKISATTVENQFSWGQFIGALNENAIVVTTTKEETASAGSVSFTTDYTPASGLTPVTDSEKKTTVAVSGSLIEADNYSLSVTTSNLESANSKFTVAEGTSAVASIDLTLKKNNETVVGDTGFGDNGLATVTTYIAKNLTSPTVYYGDDAFTAWTGSGTPTASDIATNSVKGYYTYEGVTGKLVIYTVHFSEFYVTSTDEVYNTVQGKAFANLVVANTALNEGDCLVLLKDLDFSDVVYAEYTTGRGSHGWDSLKIEKSNVTLDLNSKTIRNMDNGSLMLGHLYANDGMLSNITIKNGTLDVCQPSRHDSSKQNSYALHVMCVKNAVIENVVMSGGFNVGSVSTATLKDCVCIGVRYYTVCAQVGSTIDIYGTKYKKVSSDDGSNAMFWIQDAGTEEDIKTNENPSGAHGRSNINIHSGEFVTNVGDRQFIHALCPTVTGGTFFLNPSTITGCVPTGYVSTDNGDGTWTVTASTN